MYDGYVFNRDATRKTKCYWRCTEARRGTCLARLITEGNQVLRKQPRHDHLPNEKRLNKPKFEVIKNE